jgi:hypothetical protein
VMDFIAVRASADISPKQCIGAANQRLVIV